MPGACIGARRALLEVVKRTPSGRASEAGFLLVEAVVAVALVTICAGAALAAVVAVTQARDHAEPTSSLTLTAQNILTDLRAATAYDPGQLAALDGQSRSFDADEPGPDGAPRRAHIVVAVTRSTGSEETVARVTVSASNGTTVTVNGTLMQEAPAPGSVILGNTPPSDPSATDEPDKISL